ncbi:protein of unknown function [Methylocaldum szegediense]|uniref:Uncharacterized protein n=1 Tax=Methylocaldum szegediense TaxID=73780 RepID=A0ABM9HZZ5_9GAMM|nr:protein of unknown function [Methylocaldum szegediense]
MERPIGITFENGARQTQDTVTLLPQTAQPTTITHSRSTAPNTLASKPLSRWRELGPFTLQILLE